MRSYLGVAIKYFLAGVLIQVVSIIIVAHSFHGPGKLVHTGFATASYDSFMWGNTMNPLSNGQVTVYVSPRPICQIIALSAFVAMMGLFYHAWQTKRDNDDESGTLSVYSTSNDDDDEETSVKTKTPAQEQTSQIMPQQAYYPVQYQGMPPGMVYTPPPMPPSIK